jgi:hypothetical protein
VASRASKLIEYEWGRYFDALGLTGERLLVTVGLCPGERGDDDGTALRTRQWRQRARPLRAIRYDSRSDEIEVAVADRGSHAGLRYFVCTPHSIRLEEFDHTKVISVLDASGVQTRIFLFEAISR